MKKSRIFCLLLSIMLVFSALPMAVLGVSEEESVSKGCHSVDAAMTLAPNERLTETAQAVILYELNSETMLYTWNPDEKIYPTSMVKLMTVLLALENADPTDVVTVTRGALNQLPVGIVSAGLKAGEELTVEDLMYCTMVGSANDASVVLAEYVAGSQAAFVDMMNARAAELGCKGTHYSNAHGLHEEDTYTTVRDICRITEAALQNEEFAKIFQTASYTVPATNKSQERQITTTNHMMNPNNKKYYDTRVTGGKTGATDSGGRCLTLTAEVNGMNLLCVVMGAKPTVEENGSLSAYGSFEESKVLLDYAFQSFAYRQVFFDGQSISQYPVTGGAHHVVTQPAVSASTVFPVDGDISQLNWVYYMEKGELVAPLKAGDKLGTVQVWYGEKCLAQTDMVAMNDVPLAQAPIVPEKPTYMEDGGSWSLLIWIMIAAVVVIILVLGGKIGFRAIRIVMMERKRKRRAQRRR